MSTIQKRDSENQMPANTEANLDIKSKVKSVGVLESTSVEHISEYAAAWGAGRFNVGDVDAALAEFFNEDCVLDASAAAHSGVAAYKVHHGFAGLKEWFDFSGGFEFEGMEVSHVTGAAPNEVWMRFSAKNVTWKATGKGAQFDCLIVFTFTGDKISKMKVAIIDPASVAAVMSEGDVPIPSAVQLPAFEPHPNPMEPFGEKMALWGAGEFAKPEVRSKHLQPDCVDDLTDSALAVGPLGDVFKPHVGCDGVGLWIEHQTLWEMTNIDVTPVVGLKPGCLTARMTCDVKHKTTGKEAKGVEMYNEFAYNADGQFVYARHYMVNAPLLASIY